ncbi:MAG: DUF2281 domain-containing protein [Candidatus Methylumidiphilus sp.]
MNHIQEINNQCQRLPEDLQKQVLDFVCFLESRYFAKGSKQSDKSLSDTELIQACGILKAPRGVSLEEMETAIKQRGGKL